MRKTTVLVVGLAVVGAVLFFLARHSRHGFDPAEKPLAPAFSLTDLDGRPIVLNSYRGKVVLLNFWATWCEPCRKEIPRFIQFQDSYGPRGLQVLGISMDDDSKPVRQFRNQYRVNYPVAMGDAKLAETYGGVLGLPISFVIDPEGRIVAKHIGAVDLTKVETEIQRLLPQSSEHAMSKN
jgi:peroxiredoxin